MIRFTLAAALICSLPLFADSPVADAAERRDIAAVRALVAKKADLKAAQADGTTALHWAARWGNLEAVNLLLHGGADAKAANRFGATPLSQAAEVGATPVAEALLQAGADPKTLTTRDGETVLMTASRGGYLPIVKLLVEKGADVNAHENYRMQTALMWAAAEGHTDVVQYLLAHGADWRMHSLSRDSKMPKLSAASSVTAMASGGLTALHFAARDGNVEVGRLLLDAGADPNLVDADGAPALTVGIANKQYTFAKFLLDRGADPNAADARGRTPLYAAIDARNEDYSALPMRKESDPLPSLALIQTLLDKGANPNIALKKNLPGRSGMDAGDTTLDEGATPLMRAARAGDHAVLKLLVAKGADTKLKTHLNNDALLFAAGVGYRDKNTHGEEADALESVRYLLGLGMDLSAKNSKGETALHGAAGRGADSIAQFLIEHGASRDAATNQGLTPLDYAMGKNVLGQLPVPHDSTVAVIRKLGGREGKLITAANRSN